MSIIFGKPGSKYDISVRLGDTRKIVNALKDLEDKVQKKAAKKAARAGMTIVRKAAIAGAKTIDDKTTAERIWRNIVVQEATRSSKRVGGVYMRVGVRGGAKKYANTKENVRKGRVGKSYKTLGDASNPGGDTWYWRFVEFGTEKIPARAFMRNALRDNAQAATDRVQQVLSSEIDKLARVKR